MIRISQIKLPCGHTRVALEEKIQKFLRFDSRRLRFKIIRHSVDARKKPQLLDIYTVDVDTGLKPKEETSLIKRLKNKNITISTPFVYRFPEGGNTVLTHRPVIIGAGPAGLFCALFLSEHGYRPILIERGRKMEERTADVRKYWETGVLDPLSNVQFGEGGAGTFSDGKLNTQINDKSGRSDQVLKIFVENGAPESILWEGKPHIGTDRLREVIPRLRRKIEEAGGEVRFNTVCTGFAFEDSCTDIAERRLKGIYIETIEDSRSGSEPLNADSGSESEMAGSGSESEMAGRRAEPQNVGSGSESEMAGRRAEPQNAGSGSESEMTGRRAESENAGSGSESEMAGSGSEFLPADAVILAIGHSARDTMEMIFNQGIPMEQKQFAVGFRVAHPQSVIDESQYGISDPEKLAALGLTASPYKLTARAASGRGVYSFCMCPGGYIVNASSEQGYVCVNGMSDEKRDSGWANSAIVITVGQKEFGESDVLAGMRFQRSLEKKAFLMGKGAVPAQPYSDFCLGFSSLSDTADPPAEKYNAAASADHCGNKTASDVHFGNKTASDDHFGNKTASDDHSGNKTASADHSGNTAASADHSGNTTASADHCGNVYTGGIPLDARGGSPHSADEQTCSSCEEEKFSAPWAKGSCVKAPLHTLLPRDLTTDFIEGMEQFGRKIEGFDGPDAVLAGIESRTSSPVRITRGNSLESIGVSGLYPCGEGAGYAGGIMSAAIDGIKIAEAIASKFAPLQ